MKNLLVYPVGNSSTSHYVKIFLQQRGVPLVDHPTPEVSHLLLDVPSFGNDRQLRGGGAPERYLDMLPEYITVVGGNLEHPALDGYNKLDLLKDELYLAQNAAITAECALQVAAPLMTTTFSGCPVLIIGWGRIGKCLGKLLQALGCNVTVAARKYTDRAMLRALGYQDADPNQISCLLCDFRLIFNTVPSPILNREQLSPCRNCILIDLASQKGMDGDDVIWARGLPGIHAPESSGLLIAETLLRLLKEEK